MAVTRVAPKIPRGQRAHARRAESTDRRQEGAAATFALPGTLRVRATLKREPLDSANVVGGIFEGSDPAENEYVVSQRTSITSASAAR
jgi:hypothetical protein